MYAFICDHFLLSETHKWSVQMAFGKPFGVLCEQLLQSTVSLHQMLTQGVMEGPMDASHELSADLSELPLSSMPVTIRQEHSLLNYTAEKRSLSHVLDVIIIL